MSICPPPPTHHPTVSLTPHDVELAHTAIAPHDYDLVMILCSVRPSVILSVTIQTIGGNRRLL